MESAIRWTQTEFYTKPLLENSQAWKELHSSYRSTSCKAEVTTQVEGATTQCLQTKPWSAKQAHPSSHSPCTPGNNHRIAFCTWYKACCPRNRLSPSLFYSSSNPTRGLTISMLKETWDSQSKLLASQNWLWNIRLTVYSSEPKTAFGTLSSSHADAEISEGVKTGEETKSKPTVSIWRKNPYLVIST